MAPPVLHKTENCTPFLDEALKTEKNIPDCNTIPAHSKSSRKFCSILFFVTLTNTWTLSAHSLFLRLMFENTKTLNFAPLSHTTMMKKGTAFSQLAVPAGIVPYREYPVGSAIERLIKKKLCAFYSVMMTANKGFQN